MGANEIDPSQQTDTAMNHCASDLCAREVPAPVTLVGAGPGDPDLLTLKACKALARAETILYDHLVSDEVLALAPNSAERIYVGKESARHALPQSEICRLMVRLACAGRRVLRLKGGMVISLVVGAKRPRPWPRPVFPSR